MSDPTTWCTGTRSKRAKFLQSRRLSPEGRVEDSSSPSDRGRQIVASRNHTSPVALSHSVDAIPQSFEGVVLTIHDNVVLASFTGCAYRRRHAERSIKCHLHTGKYTQVDGDNKPLADHIQVI